jgi:hypothetical protein
MSKHELLELKSNPHVAYELWQWNKHGSARIEQRSHIPEDPRFLFDIVTTTKASKTAPEMVRREERNDISVGCSLGSVEKGIAQWASRSMITTGPVVGPGAPGKLTGGYHQWQIGSLPDSLCIDITRHEWDTGRTCTDRLECPGMLDFADGECATALAPGVAPCQYRMVGVQVGELRGKDKDPNYITWWGYVWDEGRLTWQVMADDSGSLSPVSFEEVFQHLDIESFGTTFPLRLYYRKLPPTKLLPEMPKHLIDWEAPSGYMRVPRKGPMRWVTDIDPNKPLLPPPVERQERFTLVEHVVRDPALGSFGTIYVQMIGIKLPLPKGDFEDFVQKQRNHNVGGPGDKFVVVGFTPTYQDLTPDDALLNDEREPWPKVPGTGRKVDPDDSRIPHWARSWNGSMKLGMPIPSWLTFEVAAKLAYYKHVDFNMLRMDLLTWWDHLEDSATEIFAKRPDRKRIMLQDVWDSLTSMRHGHITQLGMKFDEKTMQREPVTTLARMSLPAPRTVESLIMLTERLMHVANNHLHPTGRRIEIANLAQETVRKLSPFTFKNPNETMNDTANLFESMMKSALARGNAPPEPPPKTDAEKAEEEAERQRAKEASAWHQARRKERDDKLAAPMLAEQKRKQEAKEQAKAEEEANAKAKLKEQIESEKRGAEARQRAQEDEEKRKAAEWLAEKEAAKAARQAAAEKKKAAKKESRKCPLQREQEAQAAAIAKEKEENDAMVARVEKRLAAIALEKRGM